MTLRKLAKEMAQRSRGAALRVAEKFTPRNGETPMDFISRCRKSLGLTRTEANRVWDISNETRRKLEGNPFYVPSEVIMLKLAKGLPVDVEVLEDLYRRYRSPRS